MNKNTYKFAYKQFRQQYQLCYIKMILKIIANSKLPFAKSLRTFTLSQVKQSNKQQNELDFMSRFKQIQISKANQLSFRSSLPFYASKIRYNFSNIPFSKKTSKQIQRQISEQKWKQLQNTFQSLSTSFGLVKPTEKQLANTSYPKPSKRVYTLQTLRECSHSYPVYLYFELQNPKSEFNILINKVIDNLWKAQKKQTLEFLQFLHEWNYSAINSSFNLGSGIPLQQGKQKNNNKTDPVRELYKTMVLKFNLSLQEIFDILKKYPSLAPQIQLKIIQTINTHSPSSNDYSDLLKIISYLSNNQILTKQFYLAITKCIKQNVDTIRPGEVLEAYIYYAYKYGEYVQTKNQCKLKDAADGSNQGKVDQQQNLQEDLVADILNIIEKRMLSPQCLTFYNGVQLTALLHTFLKNSLSQDTKSQSYNHNLQKIVSRIQTSYFSQDFSSRDKRFLLQMASILPETRRKLIIALVQQELFKKKQKFQFQILPTLYLVSYENGMLGREDDGPKVKIQDGLIQNIYLIDKGQIAKILWVFVLSNSIQNSGKGLTTDLKDWSKIWKKQRLKGRQKIWRLLDKIVDIVQNSVNSFEVKDVCILVWAICAVDYTGSDKKNFWANIESYLLQQLNRGVNQIRKFSKQNANKGQEQQKKQKIIYDKDKKQTKDNAIKKQLKSNRKLLNQACWILWAFHNNRQLPIQTIDIISSIIIQQFSSQLSSSESQLSPFQLTSILSFYNSLQLPQVYKPFLDRINDICYQQFLQTYQAMDSIELCKCLKYIGHRVWKIRGKDKAKQKQLNAKNQPIETKIGDQILQIFEQQLKMDAIAYRDLMAVVAILINSQRKDAKVRQLILNLLERKKKWQSLQNIQDGKSSEQKRADGKDKVKDKQDGDINFPI